MSIVFFCENTICLYETLSAGIVKSCLFRKTTIKQQFLGNGDAIGCTKTLN
jgi:hypothetical protein